MKKLLILLLILPISLFSQEKIKEKNPNKKVDGYSGATTYKQVKGQISGRIRSNQDNKDVEYATISLKNIKTDKLIEGTITDNKGRFLFEEIPIGEYKLNISFIGFENKEIAVSTSKSKPNFKDCIESSAFSRLSFDILVAILNLLSWKYNCSNDAVASV